MSKIDEKNNFIDIRYCYGNGPYWTTKYRISSDPPLNACIARLFGKVDFIFVSGGVRGCFVV